MGAPRLEPLAEEFALRQREKAYRLLRRPTDHPIWRRAGPRCRGLWALRRALEKGLVTSIEADLYVMASHWNPSREHVILWLQERQTPAGKARALGIGLVSEEDGEAGHEAGSKKMFNSAPEGVKHFLGASAKTGANEDKPVAQLHAYPTETPATRRVVGDLLIWLGRVCRPSPVMTARVLQALVQAGFDEASSLARDLSIASTTSVKIP